MCGLGALLFGSALAHDADAQQQCREAALRQLAPRGPDYQRCVQLQHNRAYLLSTVLHLRGLTPTPQPLTNSGGDWLAWNGEVFGGLMVANDRNDGERLMTHITDTITSMDTIVDALLSSLSIIAGPFAFLYYHRLSRTLYYGRDRFGRRSLVWRCDARGLWLSSMAIDCGDGDDGQWHECGVSGLYSVSLADSDTLADNWAIALHYWPHMLAASPSLPASVSLINGVGDVADMTVVRPFARFETAAARLAIGAGCGDIDIEMQKLQMDSPSVSLSLLAPSMTIDEQFVSLLSDSVARRVVSIPLPADTRSDASPIGVMFSGGVDCTVLARLVDIHLAPHCTVDLITVAFIGHLKPLSLTTVRAIPDRVTAINSFVELKRCCPERRFRLIEVNITEAKLENAKQSLIRLCLPQRTAMDFNLAAVIYFASQADGIVRMNDREWREEIDSQYARYHCSSSTVTNSETAPTVESPEPGTRPKQRSVTKKKKHKRSQLVGDEPDEKDIELTIDDFLPLSAIGDTTINESEGDCDNVVRYRSAARVLLSGIGADELFAGYSRHRSSLLLAHRDLPTHAISGIHHLSAELDKDFHRLWLRNFGRDDRVISYHGREVRHPYLDERLIDWWRRQRASDFCNLQSEGFGVGDKKIVRRAARALGFVNTASLQKRAAQFGSRIANRRVKGQQTIDADSNVSQFVNPKFLHPHWQPMPRGQSISATEQ